MKHFKYLGVIAIVLFSFYYTEKISTIVLEKNNLYQEIENNSSNYNTASIAAIIEGDHIIPGLAGLQVNLKDSYFNMKALSIFNEFYLVYDYAYPVVSLANNSDKIIIKGNPNKKSIALVLEYDEDTINHLSSYPISVITTLDNYDKLAKYEQINNEINNYKKLENLINKYSTNTNICILNNNNETFCREKKMFLVKPNKELNNSNIINIKNNITSGDIILIKKGTSLENIDLIIKNIKYKDYTINYLSKHISEERD